MPSPTLLHALIGLGAFLVLFGLATLRFRGGDRDVATNDLGMD